MRITAAILLLLTVSADWGAPLWIVRQAAAAEDLRLDLNDPTLPIYNPPKGKALRARIGGIVRGDVNNAPMVVALVPDHVALTGRSQPTLYWYISQSTALPIFFTLRENEGVRSVLEVPLSPPKQPGIQVIRLKDYGVELKDEVTYRWFVSIQQDPDSPSQDIVSGGMIERVNFVEALTLQLSAEKGLWYDALNIISEQIEASPDDANLRRKRAALLVQIGLKEIAELDLKTKKP
jgi:hypothetical protein